MVVMLRVVVEDLVASGVAVTGAREDLAVACAASEARLCRSEERRVGEECRSRGAPYQEKTPPVAVMPPGGMSLSPAKAAALQEVQSALGAVRDAQRGGNFAQYGAALQRLDEAMNKFDAAK